MTRDEVFRLVRSAIDTRLSFPGMPDDEWDDVAEAVLAAFAARGIVLGEMEDIEVDIWPEDGEIKLPDGYALVRVVQ